MLLDCLVVMCLVVMCLVVRCLVSCCQVPFAIEYSVYVYVYYFFLFFFRVHFPAMQSETRQEKDREVKGRRLVEACRLDDTRGAKAIVADDPLLICIGTDPCGNSPVHMAASNGNLDLLVLFADSVLSMCCSTSFAMDRYLRHCTFEKENRFGTRPSSYAAGEYSRTVDTYGTYCLAFLLDHSPSGSSILAARNLHGNTCVHIALALNAIKMAEFMDRHSENGIEVFKTTSSSLGLRSDHACLAHGRWWQPCKKEQDFCALRP